ncbi:DUF6653 family protein [Pseudooceanicola atlanticus]|uniref:Uncharacterized protein n=1 Tax=Pseudooceanicola atlanticus TaxID=1461694 RepID=A0A0A0EIQ2_9RHOB|nr:DUF6653 family protein [Pseudooceanicola atlanticus]KGM49993.1 hypothetical protein ATO9_00350 [Pseudooceanicola atlanticus]
MKLIEGMQSAMGLDRTGWARHANPWSVYTRYSVLPLFVLAVWSRDWLGWGALIPVILVVIWARVNPHLFPPPASTRSWASRAVMGERVWINRARVPIPQAHAKWALGLSVLNGCGLIPLTYGLIAKDAGWTACGMAIILIGKSWFLDRMTRLFDDMSDHDTYRDWLK